MAFLALGYEVAALAFWVGARGRMEGLGRLWLWAGATGSAFYVAVSVHEGLLCPYCFLVHGCNLAMLVLAEWSRRGGVRRAAGSSLRGGVGPLLLGAVALLPFLVAQGGARRVVEKELGRSQEAITKASSADQSAARSPTTVATAPVGAGQDPGAPVFTGRYRVGPEEAVVRAVVFSDFQCPDCKRLEAEILARVRADKRFSLSLKQFPLSTVCNQNISSDMHPDACWAARAAEVAGIMGGNDAFWAMSEWLFAHNGSFDEATLRAALPAFGFDADRFIGMLESPEVASRISTDIAEGMALGIGGAQTPMIFVNGVELKGWSAPNAFGRVADALLASNAPARTAAFDHPPPAQEKILADFAAGPTVTLPEGAMRNAMGPEAAKVQIVVFGDYLEANTRDLDGRLRAMASDLAKGVRYSFQHFPFDQACNPNVPMTKHPNACVAARLAEAARVVGGDAAFWKAQAWLFEDMERTKLLLEQGLATGKLAEHLGVDAGKLLEASVSADAAAVVSADCGRGKAIGLQSLPWIVINGKVARQWTHNGEDLLPALVDVARRW